MKTERLPLCRWLSDLQDEVFPSVCDRLMRAAYACRRAPGAGPFRLPSPTWLFERVRRLRSARQVRRYLTEEAGLKHLMALHLWTLQLLTFVQDAEDGPVYREVKRLLGRRPSQASLLRAAVGLAEFGVASRGS